MALNRCLPILPYVSPEWPGLYRSICRYLYPSLSRSHFHHFAVPMTHSVLIVEDHPLYRGALIQLMQSVVGRAATVAVSSAEAGLRAIDGMADLGLILMDMGLPGLNGIEAIRAFVRASPLVPIIVVSASEDRQEANAALQAGARVFLSKAVATEAITDVARRALSGALVKTEWITANGSQSLGGAGAVVLTPRQQETLVLLSNGHSNKEIGLRMGVAEITVKVHVSAVFRALDVVNRTQAVLVGRRMGLCAQAVEASALGGVSPLV
jgi:DNA-binding NarL/FixJ family response regulator